MKWLLIHLNFNGCCYITKMDVALSQFYLWMFLHHTSETDIFTWNSMVVSTRHKWDVLTSHSWMDLFTTHNGRCYWRLVIGNNTEAIFVRAKRVLRTYVRMMRSLPWFLLICSNDTWEGGKRDENDITAKGSKSNPKSFLTPSRCVYVRYGSFAAAKSSHQDVPFQTFQIVEENYRGELKGEKLRL